MAVPSENRLRWLCRRGMLELDDWLTRFFDRHYTTLCPEQQARFAQLLEEDDMRLFDWFTAEKPAPDEYRQLVDLIRTFRIPS